MPMKTFLLVSLFSWGATPNNVGGGGYFWLCAHELLPGATLQSWTKPMLSTDQHILLLFHYLLLFYFVLLLFKHVMLRTLISLKHTVIC